MFYVLDENHNLIEAYDKEGVLAVLAQAIADGSLSGITADSGFISQLKCCVGGGTHKVAFIPQAKYNELKASNGLLEDCLYYITDDTTADDIETSLVELTKTVNGIVQGGASEYRKKAEARQQIVGIGNLPEGEKTVATWASVVDISSLMLKGKTANDVIGLRGVLRIEIGSSYGYAEFSTFLKQDYNQAEVFAFCAVDEKPYVVNCIVGFDVNNRAFITMGTAYSLNGGTAYSLSRTKFNALELFYK